MKDLFGNEIIEDVLLRDRFLEPPFSVLDSKSGNWQNRKRQWINKGIKSEIGRKDELLFKGNVKDFDYYRVKEGKKEKSDTQSTSIFDPALCELMYKWFCPVNGFILDPFCGGSVRGIVAHYLNYNYTGIELRQEQIEANKKNSLEILSINNQPNYYQGDSDLILENNFDNEFDFLFSCPPYMDLEIYSKDENDLSNMSDEKFITKYESIIKKSVSKIKKDAFACFVISDVRNKKTGFYKDFIGITKTAFYKTGMKLYNDIIFLNPVASASMRAGKIFDSGKKVTKIHQNILIFKRDIK